MKEARGHWAYVHDLPGVYGRGGTLTGAKHDLPEALTLLEDSIAAANPGP